jgi:ABC-type multidrug transport system ATPase subunit
VIVVTHRPAPLGLVKRLVILESGQVVADGPRDAVLQAVREGQVLRARAAEAAAANAHTSAAAPPARHAGATPARLSAPGTEAVAA